MFQDALSLTIPRPKSAEAYAAPVPFRIDQFSALDNLDKKGLIDTMMPNRPPSNDLDVVWDRKYVAWNFLSLERLGTIEWRQGPPSTSPNDAIRWAVLALAAMETFLRADFDYLGRTWLTRTDAERAVALRHLLVAASRHICREEPDLEIPQEVLE